MPPNYEISGPARPRPNCQLMPSPRMMPDTCWPTRRDLSDGEMGYHSIAWQPGARSIPWLTVAEAVAERMTAFGERTCSFKRPGMGLSNAANLLNV